VAERSLTINGPAIPLNAVSPGTEGRSVNAKSGPRFQGLQLRVSREVSP